MKATEYPQTDLEGYISSEVIGFYFTVCQQSVHAPNPSINLEFTPVADDVESGDPVIAIQNAIEAAIQHENAGGENTSGSTLRVLIDKLIIPEFAPGQCKHVGLMAHMGFDQALYDSYRGWIKEVSSCGHLLQLPTKLRDHFHAEMVKHSLPFSAERGIGSGKERPADPRNNGLDPHLENRVGHPA